MNRPIVPNILSYSDVLTKCGTGTKSLLLGNGFSIACSPIFKYESLYEAAKSKGLSQSAQIVFERLGTNNFEGAMRLLDDALWVGSIYQKPLGEGVLKDLQVIKDTLISAIADSHLEHSGALSDAKKESCLKFFSGYKNVFTTNYDLLPYWVIMRDESSKRRQDGFRSDEEDPEATHVVFAQRLGKSDGLYFVHGALHLYLSSGELRKHCWNRSGVRLTDNIKDGMDKGDYPLFVAEGSADKKLEQIQRVGYLWYCMDKLKSIESPLVIYGHSLGASDDHIVEAIGKNKKIKTVYIGLHGDPNGLGNQNVIRRAGLITSMSEDRRPSSIVVEFFDAATAKAWG